MDPEDILNDALTFLPDERKDRGDGTLVYGPLTVSVAPKVSGQAEISASSG